MKQQEGWMPFRNHQTYYRIVGDLKDPILLCLHGGPGSTHQYFEVLDELANQGLCLIMYDQLGCGKSYVENQPSWWTMETWLEELDALVHNLKLQEFHLLGQSFGGMLAIEYYLRYSPRQVKSLILSSTLSSASLWAKEQHRWIKMMDQKDQFVIAEAEKTGNFLHPDYLLANERFMQAHCGSFSDHDYPCLKVPYQKGSESYLIAWGPNEYVPNGTLRNYERTEDLKNIQVPCLIISGTEDLCSPVVAKAMFDHLPNAQWSLVEDARHMVFLDQHDLYLSLLLKWIRPF